MPSFLLEKKKKKKKQGSYLQLNSFVCNMACVTSTLGKGTIPPPLQFMPIQSAIFMNFFISMKLSFTINKNY